MKIMIVSDTHGRDDRFWEALKPELPIDLLIHAGDAEGSEDDFQIIADCPMKYVAGNNDFYSSADYEMVFELGPHTVFLTHGHRYHVSMSEDMLLDRAREIGADIAIYGHTHRPVIRMDASTDLRDSGDVLVINPGSLGYPRQEGRHPSYIIAEMDKTGKINCQVKYLT